MQVLLYDGLDPDRIPGLPKLASYLEDENFAAAESKKVGDNLFRAKLDRSDRILFSFARHRNRTVILVLEHIRRHATRSRGSCRAARRSTKPSCPTSRHCRRTRSRKRHRCRSSIPGGRASTFSTRRFRSTTTSMRCSLCQIVHPNYFSWTGPLRGDRHARRPESLGAPPFPDPAGVLHPRSQGPRIRQRRPLRLRVRRPGTVPRDRIGCRRRPCQERRTALRPRPRQGRQVAGDLQIPHQRAVRRGHTRHRQRLPRRADAAATALRPARDRTLRGAARP